MQTIQKLSKSQIQQIYAWISKSEPDAIIPGSSQKQTVQTYIKDELESRTGDGETITESQLIQGLLQKTL